MSKRKKPEIFGLDMEGIPEGLKKEITSFIEEQIIGDRGKETLKPLVTISQKDVMKQQRIIGRRDMVRALMGTFKEVAEKTSEELSEWWEYIEDKYNIPSGLDLKIEPETGVISQRIKESEPLKVIKKDPLN